MLLPPPLPGSTVAAYDLLEALEFAQRRFEQWHKEGHFKDEQLQALNAHYSRRRELVQQAQQAGQELHADHLRSNELCWSCGQPVAAPETLCTKCGAPLSVPAVKSLRYLAFLEQELEGHKKSQLLQLAQVHALLADTRQRGATLKNRLEQDRIPLVRAARVRRPAPEPTLWAVPVQETQPRRSPLEIILDPRSIQWLLASGGALMVFGLVVYLLITGVFQEPVFAAVVLGVATLALLFGGWALMLGTRFRMAGRALTLLACLVMPLNLWFYQMQGLLSVDAGGRLWLPALICCVLYLASALVLRDELFVYVLAGGVALTGLLVLANLDYYRFWQVAAPSVLLVGLGLFCVHAERVFQPGDGPFTRRRFGMAFFWSGQALLGGGFLLLLVTHFYAFARPALQTLVTDVELIDPAIVSDPPLRILALVLVLSAVYVYLYSDLVVRRVGVYIYLATFAVLWAEVLVVHLLDVKVSPEGIILTLAATAFVANLLQTPLAKRIDTFDRSGPPLGMFLCTLPILLGLMLHIRATTPVWQRLLPYTPDWWYVGAMLATALSCRYGAFLYRHQLPWLSAVYFFGTAAATVVGAAGLLMVLNVTAFPEQAPLLILIPIAYLLAARLYRGLTPERPLVWVAHTAVVLMLVAAVLHGLDRLQGMTIDHVTGKGLNLLLGVFWLEAAAFYVLAALFRRESGAVYLATLTAAAGLWQFLSFGEVAPEYQTLAFAALGLAMLLTYRFGALHRFKKEGLEEALFQSANGLLSVAFVAAVLVAIPQMGSGLGAARTEVFQREFFLLTTMVVLSCLAVWWVRDRGWRTWYTVVAVVESMLAMLNLYSLLNLTPLEAAEFFSIVLGLILLVVGHVGWYREQERENDVVSLCLAFGSLLVGVPLVIAVVGYRWSGRHHLPDEVGLLVATVVLFGTGFMCRIKSTTMVGVSLGVVYLLSLALFIKVPEAMGSTAVGIAIGGAALFVVGLLLSIYRERLLELPEKIRRREGIFRVLTWR